MNISKTNICNISLALLGAQIISELDEPSKEAKGCKIFYENAKNKLLAAHDWPFASKKSLLNKIKCNEQQKNLNTFKIPADCIALREITDEIGGKINYEISSTGIETGATHLTLRYTATIDDTSFFPPDFIDTLAYLLASDMAIFLTDSHQSAQTFAALAEKKAEKACEAWAILKAEEQFTQNMPFTALGR